MDKDRATYDDYDIPMVTDGNNKYAPQSGHRCARVWVNHAPALEGLDAITPDGGEYPQVGDILIQGTTVQIRGAGGWVTVS